MVRGLNIKATEELTGCEREPTVLSILGDARLLRLFRRSDGAAGVLRTDANSEQESNAR